MPRVAEERFVGRQSELRRLGELLAQATRGGPLVVALHGPCGIGKSRVLSEMERRIRRAGFNVGFYQASCPVRGATEPLSALGTMLGTLCGVQEGDDASRLLDLVPRLRALGLRERERNAVLRHLGAPVPDAAQGDPTKEILQVAFTRMVQSLSEDRVQCFSWDDAQHFDPASLDILTSVAAREGLRATFVLATRELAPFEPLLDAAGARGARVELRELSEEESVRLIAHRLGGRTVPPELVAFCRERAGGQPLYLEELVRELGDSGAVSVLTGNIRARLDAVTTTVPRTLRTLVGARISRLPPAERALLQAASILGERAPVEVLAAVLGQTVVQVDRGAAGLAAKELLRAPNLATVEFTSPMHAEVIREDMTVEQRRELHARAAQAFAERGDELESAEGAAHHLTLAGERDAAATQWARAAVARARGGRLDLAVRCWLRAFELADFSTRGAPEIEAWLSGLATAVSRLRRAPGLVELLPAPLARLDALLGAAAGGGDPAGLPGRIRARVHVARALMGVNQFAATSQHVDEAKALLAGVADHALADELRRATLQIDLEASVRSGDNSRGVRAADQLEAMGIGGDPRLLLGVAGCRSVAGDPARALALIQQAEELARPDDLLLQYDIAKQRGLLGIQSMDYAAAVAASERAVELARTTGLAFDLGAALHNLGDACHRRGELPRAYAALTDSLEVTLEAGLERLASLNRLHLTYLDALRGDEKAEGLLRDLIRYAETRGFWTDVMQGRYLLGRALLRRGVRGPARVELTEVLTMAREYDDMAAEADARQALAELDERASAAPPG